MKKISDDINYPLIEKITVYLEDGRGCEVSEIYTKKDLKEVIGFIWNILKK